MIVDDALCDRIIEIEIENLRTRMAEQARRGTNGVAIADFGPITAFAAADLPVRFFNSALGLGDASLARLDEVLEWYLARGVEPAFEVVPSRMSERLGEDLHARGFRMLEFHAGLAMRPNLEVPASPIAVRELGPESIDRFLDVYLEGWGRGADAKADLRGWADNPTWRFFLAEDEGRAVGCAILDQRGTTAMLGSAATVPAGRGRGAQAALIHRRKHEAAKAGADLLVGGAYFGTTSMRNQQRCGLELAFTRGIWSRVPCLTASH